MKNKKHISKYICLFILLLSLSGCNLQKPPVEGELVFSSTRSGVEEIYRLDLSTNETVQLTHNPFGNGGPVWSPDGQWIVYTACQEDHQCYISYMDRDGNHATHLRSVQNFLIYSWSPDGQRIWYDLEQKICSIDLEGENEICSDEIPGLISVRLSPNGSKLAYVVDEYPDVIIRIVNTENLDDILDTIQIASSDNWTGNVLLFPGWSKDGKKITYTYYQSDRTILWKDFDSGETYSIGKGAFGCWSPDGEWLAFTRMFRKDSELYLVNQDGNKQYRLTYSKGDNLSPDWKK